MKIDNKYLIKVSDYQPIPLPKPKKKSINIISILSGEDDLMFKWGGWKCSSE